MIVLGLNCCRQSGTNVTSEAHFMAAEQGLAEGHFNLAAKRLDQGIVAYRMETGKMSGAYAVRANRAIDGLIRIRRSLRHGDPVACEALHEAILVAIASGNRPIPSAAQPDPGLMQTVGGR